jgi:hypothetical protein
MATTKQWTLVTKQDRDLANYLNSLSEKGDEVFMVYPSIKAMGSYDVLSHTVEAPDAAPVATPVAAPVEAKKKPAPAKKPVKKAPAPPAVPTPEATNVGA